MAAEAAPSNNDTKKQLAADNCKKLLPTAEWKQLQFQNFALTRSKIITMRESLIALNPNNTAALPSSQDHEMIWLEFCRQHQPKLSITLRLGQRLLEQLLQMLSEWLSDDNLADLGTASSATAAEPIVNQCDLNANEQWLGSWLYAVLSCLQTPLEPDVHSTLRDIARACIRLRNNIAIEEHEKAIPYNLFIFLIAKYFGQLDFMEYI